MPAESDVRLTLSVGRREFEALTAAWAAYTEVTQPEKGSVDPVLAMQRTGFVLRSLNAVMETLEADEPDEGRVGQ
jgi:hypothetical protein